MSGHVACSRVARLVGAAALLAVLCVNSRQLHAQVCVPPVNEECGGALPFSFEQLPLTASGLLGCANNMVDRPYFDVFYRYDCTVSGDYQFDMCGSLGDTYMRVYFDGCGFGPASTWVEDDDGCGGSPNSLDPLIVVSLEAGTSVWIELGSWRVDDFFPPNANDPYEFHASFLGGGLAPWQGLGGGTVGINGPVTLIGTGSLTGGSSASLSLTNAPPNSALLAWLSFGSTPAFFFGGTVHAMPFAQQFLFQADALGELEVSATWPAGVPAGTEAWFQFFAEDPSVLWGITLSNAIKATTP